MQIQLSNSQMEDRDIESKIQSIFPELKVKMHSLFGKKGTIIQKNDWVMSRVIHKGDHLVVKGEPSNVSTIMRVIFVAGILTAPLGILLVVGFMFGVKGKEAKAFGEDVYNKLNGQF